jgi:lysophospholipase L1-like esterase
MIRPPRPATVARGAAVGGTGIGLLGAMGYGLIKLEATLARRRVPRLHAAPVADGVYGDPAGRPLRLAMLGDSGAAGFGAEYSDDTPGALLATVLAERGLHVTLDVLAVTGARSADLAMQVEWALLAPPDLVVVQIGANDITHWVPPRQATVHLADAIRRLRDAGARVVVGTCPDLGALRFIPQPLRAVGRLKSQQMAAAQAIAVVEAGGVPVALGAHLGRRFETVPSLFCFDRFHPSAEGYREIVDALLPAVLTAAGLDDDEVATPAGV